jgi:site-specific DNA-methyltransferase (adenine-specific)/modification methylase
VIPFLEPVDLVLTDPPYGINENSKKVASRGKLASPKDYGVFNWDKNPVKQWIVDMVLDCSKYQVIWGGNYYNLPPCKGPLVWDKMNGNNDFADGEIAWNNYGIALRIKHHLWNGMIRKGQEDRFHPTQKPLEVISWAISLCPAEPQTILDPFMGSGTTLRAAKDLGRKAIGIEIEKKYCDIAVERLRQEVLKL